MKYWEAIAANLKQVRFSLGLVSALDDHGRRVWMVDAHRDGKRFVVRADEGLTAFVEIKRAICEFAVAIVLDQEVSVSQDSATLNGPESGGGLFPR